MRLLLMVALAAVLGLVSAGAGRAETPTPAPGEISGFVFHDTDGDGVRDEGENGLAGRQIDLSRSQGHLQTVVSSSDGSFVLAGVDQGEYTVTVNVDARQGICSSGVATFNPFPYTYCVSATIPWRNTTPTELLIAVSDTTGAVADFGARPADIAVLEGLALIEDDYAPPGTRIEAVVNGQVCGSTIVPDPNGGFIGDHRFELHVLGAVEQPGCAGRGDSVAFRVGGVPAVESFSWVPFSDLTTFAQFRFVYLTAIRQHAWYWYEQSESDLPAVGTRVQTVIDGTVCGEARVESQGTGLSGFSKLLVPSAELQPGCGRPGAMASFLFDGVPTGDSIEWRPGLQDVSDLAKAPVLPPSGTGATRSTHIRTIAGPFALASMAAVLLLTYGARARRPE